MSTFDFVVGPVLIDGHQLNFFVELKAPDAALEILAAAYTAVAMRDKAEELTFDAYATRHTRMSEDDWYGVAREQFNLYLRAVREDAAIRRTIHQVVEQQYFGNAVPEQVRKALTPAMQPSQEEARHAA